MSDPDCIFCKIVAGEIPGQIIAEDAHAIAIMDINHATRGHALVIPHRHSRDLLKIDPDDLAHRSPAPSVLRGGSRTGSAPTA